MTQTAATVRSATTRSPDPGQVKRSVLIVGNFVSAWKPYRGVCEDLASQLSTWGASVVTTSRVRNRSLRLLDMLATVWRRRADYRVAQVDVFSGRAFLWAEATCRLLRHLGKPYVLTLHGGNLPHFAARHPARVRRLLESAAAVTAPSVYLLVGLRPFRADLRLIPNPISIDLYPFRLRRSLRPHLIWLRSFHDLYDPALAVGVLADLATDFADATLTMVGPDQRDGSRERARALAARAGVLERVRFVGGVPKAEVPGWLASGDIFLNTSRVDNVPVSVLEAMACGLCVVSTEVGGIPALVENGRDALLVGAGDAGGMASAVRRLLSNPDLAHALSAAARETADRHDWRHVLPRWTALLDEVVAARVVAPTPP